MCGCRAVADRKSAFYLSPRLYVKAGLAFLIEGTPLPDYPVQDFMFLLEHGIIIYGIILQNNQPYE